MEGPPIQIRLLTPADDLAELTELLHRAYRKLAERGLLFLATHQDEPTTRRRIAKSECYVATREDRVIGTIAFHPPAATSGTPWYDRPDVASFGQFGVEPAWQQRGVGSRLLDHVEQRAHAIGAKEIALDTAEPAEDLIQFYTRRGYRTIEHTKWDCVNYRSAIMSKTISGGQCPPYAKHQT